MVDDDFYEPLSTAVQRSGLISKLWGLILSIPLSLIVTVLLSLPLIVVATRLLSGYHPGGPDGKQGRAVRKVPYWIPVIGHGFSAFSDPAKLMSEWRDRTPHGIFALNLDMTTHNIISEPVLAESVLQRDESTMQFRAIAWRFANKFFGIPDRSRTKHSIAWEHLDSTLEDLTEGSHLNGLLRPTTRNLEKILPQMISFVDTDIDLHSWERWASASYISNSESEIGLMTLMRDMSGSCSVPAFFGSGLMEKYPNLLHDIYDMDAGMAYFMLGLPAWTPWPALNSAYRARQRVWESLDNLQEALDASVEGNHVDPTWGDLDDVSDFIMKRHALYKEHGFKVTERADISILWALVVDAGLVVYWQLLRILDTPGLVDRIRAEIAPYAQVSKPLSIGIFSEAPKLTLSHEGLSNKCPLLKATYFETLRLTSRASSVRQVATDATIQHPTESVSYTLRRGEYVTVPHDLHMRDPRYFKDPEVFDPERFLVQNADGSRSAEMGSIRPYGSGQSMCKERAFVESGCLSLVAGVLALWDIEPTGTAGWVIPGQGKRSGVSLPVDETRVRIKPRRFEWDG